MSTVRAHNMTVDHIFLTIGKIARKQLDCPQVWKIKLLGQPIGKMDLKEDLSTEEKRYEFSLRLQKSLERRIEICNHIIYVGPKLY